MLNLNQPNIALLDAPANRESRPLDYAILAIHWLYWARTQNNPHLAHIDPHFMEAMEADPSFFDAGIHLPASDAVERLREHLAYGVGTWTRKFTRLRN